MTTMNKKAGFTIVELLLVVIVIVILATISVLSYNGIQTRAQDQTTLSAVKSYKNALYIYRSDNGRYPSYTDTGYSYFNCLGDQYLNDRCYNSDSYRESTLLNAALKSNIGSLPMPTIFTGVNPYSVGGIAYIPTGDQAPNTFWTMDGKPTHWLIYTLSGSESKCSAGPIASVNPAYNGTTVLSYFTATPPASEQTTGGTNPVCWLPIRE